MPTVSELQCLKDVQPLPPDAKYQPTVSDSFVSCSLNKGKLICQWFSSTYMYNLLYWRQCNGIEIGEYAQVHLTIIAATTENTVAWIMPAFYSKLWFIVSMTLLLMP